MGAEQLNKFSKFTITRGALYPRGDWLGNMHSRRCMLSLPGAFRRFRGGSPLPASGYAISEYLDLMCYFGGIGYVE